MVVMSMPHTIASVTSLMNSGKYKHLNLPYVNIFVDFGSICYDNVIHFFLVESNVRLDSQVWKYQGTDRLGISALKHLNVDVQTVEGRFRTDVLLTGSINGSLR